MPRSPRLRSYLLSPDDQFYIPPNNVYRLENHSTTETCRVFWTIIKHHEMEEADDEWEGDVRRQTRRREKRGDSGTHRTRGCSLRGLLRLL